MPRESLFEAPYSCLETWTVEEHRCFELSASLDALSHEMAPELGRLYTADTSRWGEHFPMYVAKNGTNMTAWGRGRAPGSCSFVSLPWHIDDKTGQLTLLPIHTKLKVGEQQSIWANSDRSLVIRANALIDTYAEIVREMGTEHDKDCLAEVEGPMRAVARQLDTYTFADLSKQPPSIKDIFPADFG